MLVKMSNSYKMSSNGLESKGWVPFRSLSSGVQKTRCPWIKYDSVRYTCRSRKKTAAGRGCPNSRQDPSESTSLHEFSSLWYSQFSISHTGQRTCSEKKQRAIKQRRGNVKIKGCGSRPP